MEVQFPVSYVEHVLRNELCSSSRQPVVREVQMAGDRCFAAFASTAENTQNLLGHL